MRVLGVSSEAGHGGQRILLASGSLVQSEVKVGRRRHGIKNVGLVWYEQVCNTQECDLAVNRHIFSSSSSRHLFPTSSLGDELNQAKVPAAEMLQVVFLQSLLDHMGSFVLAGQL